MKKFLTGIGLLASSMMYAQDTTKTSNLAISGSVDGYYRFNFLNAKDAKLTNNLNSFTNSHNSFELGMASIRADYARGKVSATVDLGFGRRAEEFSYNDSGALTAIKQAYLSYAPSDNIKFTLGKWGTHVGYELVDAYLNRNYSMSYIFSYGPFFHTGLKADFTFDNFGLMVGVANPTDLFSASFAKKFLIGQVSATTENGNMKGYLNYVGGKYEDETSVNQVDLVVTGVVSDQFSIGYNGTIQMLKPEDGDSESWWGSALYLNYDPVKVFGLTLRGEYFDDEKGVSGLTTIVGVPTKVFAATLSGNIRIDNLTIIPEFRLDNADDPVFFKNSGEAVKSTGTFILAATFRF